MGHLPCWHLQHALSVIILLQLPQIHAVCASSGILQQPGESFARPHLGHLIWSCLQHKSPPFIWPHSRQRRRSVLADFSLLLFALPDFSQPALHRNAPTKAVIITTRRYLLLILAVHCSLISISFPNSHSAILPHCLYVLGSSSAIVLKSESGIGIGLWTRRKHHCISRPSGANLLRQSLHQEVCRLFDAGTLDRPVFRGRHRARYRGSRKFPDWRK